jgi:hypothetical protein
VESIPRPDITVFWATRVQMYCSKDSLTYKVTRRPSGLFGLCAH